MPAAPERFRERLAELFDGLDPGARRALGWTGDELPELRDARDLARRLPELAGPARSQAVWVLGHLKDRRVVPVLLDLLLHDPMERSQAAISLGSLGGRRAVAALLAALAHPDPEVRLWSIYALNDIGDDRALEPILARAADPHEAVAVRAQAVEALGAQLMCDRRRTAFRRRVIALVLQLLAEETVELRFWAAYAAGVMRVRKALPLLEAMRSDPRMMPTWWSLAEEADWAIAAILGRPEPEGFPRTRDPRSAAA